MPGPTRRAVLASLAAGSAAALLPRPSAGQAPGYLLPDWTGDSFAPMHAVRDGAWDRPVPPPRRRVDVVIVGAGIAGLTAARRLRHRDILVLERERRPGGNSKSAAWRGIAYSEAAAYVSTGEEPYGAFYADLGLTLRPVAHPADVALSAGGGDALTGDLADAFHRLRKRLGAIADSDDYPDIPIAAADARTLGLDRISFRDWLGPDTPPRLLRLVDAYCWSALGGGVETISAYAGINFYSEIDRDIYAFPGGNAAVTAALVRKIDAAGRGRIVTGASVFAIEPDAGGRLKIGWFDTMAADPQPQSVSARWVVLAVPYYFAARLLRGLDPRVRDAMTGLTYGSYVVANLCFSGRVPVTAFDHWTLDSEVITDVVSADWVVPAARRSPRDSVLTVYAPFRDPALGRATLEQGDRAAVAAPIVEAVRSHLPGAAGARLEEVRLSRYGHQLLASRVGLVETVRALPKRFGNVLLAHSDGQAMAAIECAILEGQWAARTIRRGTA